MRLGAVLLASGSGRRFGSNKLLIRVGDAPLVQRIMDALPLDRFARAAVCSPYPEVLRLAQERGYLPLQNVHAQEGVSASIRLGLSVMEGLDGVLFSVCDQPYLTTESILRLLDSFAESPHSICALSWQGERGNPVLFPARFFPELSALTGDTGGGKIIKAHQDSLRLVEVYSPKELQDIDTVEDLS